MAKQKKSRTKQKGTSSVTEEELEIITGLGGDKKDTALFEGVEDEGESIEITEDFDAEPIKREEVHDFIKELGFDDIMEVTFEDTKESKSAAKKEKQNTKSAVKQNEKPPGDASNATTSNTVSKTGQKKKKNKYKIQDEEISSTTAELDLNFMKEYQPRTYLLVKTGGKWFENLSKSDQPTDDSAPGVESKLRDLQTHAKQVYHDETNLYRKQLESSKKSDNTWIQTVLKSGTLSDKMAALTLLIQEAPVHNLSSLESLITTVKKKGRREALLAIGTLKELFLTELLPEDRKLIAFDQQPLGRLNEMTGGNKDTRDKKFIMWHFEDQLRQKYTDFVNALETLCHDTILAAKLKSLAAVFELLAGKPEQEKKLLSILTNKLGDPDYKVASKAAHLLTKLVEQHPNMKNVVVAEVERLVYRPNVAEKAQYYAVCFLNQIVFTKKETDLAIRLINIYFSFFKAFVKKGEVDSKMMSGLLMGVNRAYPFAKVEEEKISAQMDTLYRIVHIVKFNTSIQALMLLYQVMGSSQRTSDRYYQALYGKLLDPSLITSSKQAMFLNLLFKSMKADTVDRRIKAFIKRLLQVCCSLPVPFICGSLVLLSQILKVKPTLFQFAQTSQESDDEDEHFVDVKTEDVDNTEEKHMETEEESDSKTQENRLEEDVRKALGHHGHTTTASWVHRRNLNDRAESRDYDPHHRNPLYTRSETACVWEIEKLVSHFHPSVALFASNVLKGSGVDYSGDPLEDFTLVRFLDRFVFRNPKKRENLKDKGVTKGTDRFQSWTKKSVGAKSVAVNSEEYLKMEESDIPVDEKFFHRYFSKKALKKTAAAEEFDSDVDDDEFDNFLDNYEKGFDGADFAGEFTKSALSKSALKGKNRKAEEDDDLSDLDDDDDDADDDDDDLSGEEFDFDDDQEIRAAFDGGDDDFDEDDDDDEFSGNDDDFGSEGGEDMDFDEENISFSDASDDLDNFAETTSGGKRKSKTADVFLDGVPPSKKKGKRPKEFDTSNLFAAAEEFSHMIDESSSTKLSDIGTEALSNKDNADAKQLNWEANRDRWMRGQDWRSKKGKRGPKHGGGGFKGRHQQSNKPRPANKGQHGHKKKGRK